MNKNYKDRGSLHTRVRREGANLRLIWLNSCAPARPAYTNVSPKSPKLAWHVFNFLLNFFNSFTPLWIQTSCNSFTIISCCYAIQFLNWIQKFNIKQLLHPHMTIKRHLLFFFWTLEKPAQSSLVFPSSFFVICFL